MEKATTSVLIGLLIIIIIVETTALVSMQGGCAASPPAVSKVTATASAAPQPTQAQSTAAAIKSDQAKGDATLNVTADKLANTTIQKASTAQVPKVTPVPPVGYVKYDTPILDADDSSISQIHAVAIPEPTAIPVDYLEVFHQNQTLFLNSTAISLNVKNPPMIISYSVAPKEITDIKWTMNRDAGKKTSDGKIINVTRWDENSWFELTVFDKGENGTIVEQDGFGQGHDQDLTKEIVIRNPGYYQIKFEGNLISVDTSIKVPRKGNT